MKKYLALIFLFIGTAVICLLYLIPGKVQGPALKKLSWDEVDISGNFQDRRLVVQGINRSILILKNLKDGEALSLASVPVPASALLLSLQRLKDLFSTGSSTHVILTVLQEEFTPYEIRGGPGSEENPVLATGYFQPCFDGSYNATEAFAFPVYGWPDDLVRADLHLFDRALPHHTIWGRVSNRRLVPYYSRAEIEQRRRLSPELALCWLASPADVLELHIQGSGIINFPGGQSRFIHYAASNGRPYKSIGKVLREKGLLPPGQLDWPGIRKWAETHPERFREVVSENPRYIFFRWEKTGPIGCFGQVLVPGTSAALDSSRYPPGVPGLLLVRWPGLKSGPDWFKNRPGALVVFNHDRGNAIKGPFRVDLYCGSGPQAGQLAGRLKNPARFIILLHRDIALPGF